MGSGYEESWSTLPEKALHPRRVPAIEALLWIEQPLSAIDLVDLFDGLLSMWDAIHHLRALEALGVAELASVDPDRRQRNEPFDVLYRLRGRRSEGR